MSNDDDRRRAARATVQAMWDLTKRQLDQAAHLLKDDADRLYLVQVAQRGCALIEADQATDLMPGQVALSHAYALMVLARVAGADPHSMLDTVMGLRDQGDAILKARLGDTGGGGS